MDSQTAIRRPAVSIVHRLYGGVSRAGLAAALGLVGLFSFSRVLWGFFDDIRYGPVLPAAVEACAGFAIDAASALAMVAIVAPVMHLGPPSGWRRLAALGVALVVAAVAAALLCFALQWLMGWASQFGRLFLRFGVRFGCLGGLFMLAAEIYRHALRSAAELQRAERDRLVLERETAAAHLQVLQAQVEPHFLFNALANVRRLYRTDAAAGCDMLANLMRYLETALPRMRDEVSTLERERALVGAFLQVQKIRMGRRLGFEIDIAPELSPLEVPPMMLMTLVENALKHGLAPLPEGGRVHVQARRERDALVLRVADSGCGFGPGGSGTGMGLSNIRGRLAALYGERAALELSANLPRGVTATLRLPLAAEAVA